MCGNRVEELETRVQELEASVKGLTDELVECKVRIRELEDTVDERDGPSRASPEQAGEETATESDILVPEAGSAGTEAAEAGTSNTTAPEKSDNTADPESETDDDSGSDIIVA